MPTTPNKSEAEQAPTKPVKANGADYSVQLLEKARADTDTVLKELGSRLEGLSAAEADSRLKKVGPNEIAREKHQSALMRLLSNIKNPLVLLLLALGVVLRFYQEMRADNAAEKLQAMVSNTATLVRGGKEAEVSLKMLVPGDIIRLMCVCFPPKTCS
jgi:Mg2+-importing ATPase